MKTGQVVETIGGTYTVRTAGGTVEATLRGRLKRSGDTRDKVVIGDRVGVVEAWGGGHVIESVQPRRTYLARRTAVGAWPRWWRPTWTASWWWRRLRTLPRPPG